MVTIEPLFLPLGQGTRFCLLHAPAKGARERGAIVYVHPFAEEMNKSRRSAALQSRAFAASGWTTLQLDLFGCGDSPGDFADARWEQWVDDVVDACVWLALRTGHEPLLWGLRTGCLIAAHAASRSARAAKLLLWQPVVTGSQHLQQFIRLKGASELMAQKTDHAAAGPALRRALERGETVEVAGYPLSPSLASSLERAELELPRVAARIAWLEIRSAGGDLSPGARARVDALCASGHHVRPRVVQGPAFWNVVDGEASSALIESTIEAAAELHS
jgi:exosortase A-associated hydrolase 2